MENEKLIDIVRYFHIEGTVAAIFPLGNGLINDTYRVITLETDAPDYILQRVNHRIFKDIDLLQNNIETVTMHLRHKLLAEGVDDIDRKVLRFVTTTSGKSYCFDGRFYWRVSVYIADTMIVEVVTPQSSYDCGCAFGEFQRQLTDLNEPLGETIPDFHNIELRLNQLRDAVALFPMVQAVRFLTDFLNGDTYYKIRYPEHNLVRVRNQLRYFQQVQTFRQEMSDFVMTFGHRFGQHEN